MLGPMQCITKCLIISYTSADCGGQLRSGVSLLEIIDYLNPEAVNTTFHQCPPTVSPTEGAMQYLTTGVLYLTDI